MCVWNRRYWNDTAKSRWVTLTNHTVIIIINHGILYSNRNKKNAMLSMIILRVHQFQRQRQSIHLFFAVTSQITEISKGDLPLVAIVCRLMWQQVSSQFVTSTTEFNKSNISVMKWQYQLKVIISSCHFSPPRIFQDVWLPPECIAFLFWLRYK